MDRISNAEENLGQRISTVEENLNKRIAKAVERTKKLDGTVDHLEGKLHVQDMMISDLKEALQDKNETIRKLEDEVDNIQGRIRRKTLIFRGVPEGAEGSQGWLSCKRYPEKILIENFGYQQAHTIERAHMTPPRRNPERDTPRPIHAALLNWSDANNIISTAAKILRQKLIQYNGEDINVCVDQMYSPRVTALRNQALVARKTAKARSSRVDDSIYETSSKTLC